MPQTTPSFRTPPPTPAVTTKAWLPTEHSRAWGGSPPSRTGGISSTIISFAEREKLDSAREAFEEIRSLCVSCHVKFRENNFESGLFPARDNTIAGQVEIRKLDGTPRKDRSNVVVFLEGVNGGVAVGPPPRRNPVVSQKNRLFWPRVLTIVKGTTVEFPNDDTIFHNVFSLSKARPFDLDIYAAGVSKSVHFSKTLLQPSEFLLPGVWYNAS